MNYEIDQCYDFIVDQELSQQSDIFYLKPLDSTESPTLTLPKLEFQKQNNWILPETLLCRVKGESADGLPILAHVIAPYVYELYGEGFLRGETFEFLVTSIPANPVEEPFSVRDKNGIYYRLSEPEGLLTKGQIVRCKFTKMTPKYFSMERVDEGAKIPFFKPSELFDAVGMNSRIKRFVTEHLFRRPEMFNVRVDIQTKKPLWPLSAARLILDHLPEWYIQADLKQNNSAQRALLDAMRSVLLYLLEGSGFLNSVPAARRRSIQEQLTELVDLLNPYFRALDILRSGRQDKFVEDIFDKLQKSGFLYHPARQFAILMLIFRLNPEKVGYYLSRIFESIFSRDLENWKIDPFRSAFVEQFEIYVRQARKEIDLLPLAENKDQKSHLETIITALALQLLLAENEEELSRNFSLYFRYISLLRPLNTEVLLSKSFLALLGVKLPAAKPSYKQLREPMMMMTQATVMPAADIFSCIESTHRFSNGTVDITISAAGIILSLSGRRDITERIIPEDLMPWLKPQIKLNGIKSLSGTKLRKLADHNQWWHSIETSLFDNTALTVREQKNQEKRAAVPGDQVYIVIDSIEDYDFVNSNPSFRATISDEEFLEGTGTIKRDMIVGFNLKSHAFRTFSSPDGTPYGFLATVIAKDENGKYSFSLRDEVDLYIDNSLNYEDEFTAVVTGINQRDYSAICSLGFGIFLEQSPEMELNVSDIVRFKVTKKGPQGNVRGYVTAVSHDPSDQFDKMEAFGSMMRSIAVDPAENESEDSDLFRDNDEILSAEDIRELIEIIRFKAIAENDLIKAYDYLRFARILAKVISDEHFAEKLSAHAALLTLHQYFATNSNIDSDKLEALKPIAYADPFLKMIFQRLEMVSWLGKQQHNQDLFAFVNNPSNELAGSIAGMVLSYNLVNQASSDDNSIASGLKGKIMEKLNVNNETKNTKYYGSESKYLEFKTSIVFPAVSPGQEMRQDPETQLFHILSRIAGFLNANGGRLYLGVNNDGYAVGLHDDFKYFERHKATAGKINFTVKNLEQMCLFLENLVAYKFGAKAARKIEIAADSETDKDVILISITESPDPVFLDERLFVRQSGQSTKEYHGKEISDFVKERLELRAEREHMLAMATKASLDNIEIPNFDEIVNADSNGQPENTVSVQLQQAETDVTTDNGNDTIALATSRWRPNILHNYEDGFEQPLGYLYFTDQNQLFFSRYDIYMETGIDSCRLALTIPHGMNDAWLILAFQGEQAMKINVQDILEKGDNNPMDIYNNAELMFAALARDNDGLVAVFVASSSSKAVKRMVPIAQIEQVHDLSASPKRILDAPAEKSLDWEIADSSSISNFTDCSAAKLGTKRAGFPMNVKKGEQRYDEKLDELVTQAKPAL